MANMLETFFWGLPLFFLIRIQYRLYALFLPERFAHPRTASVSAFVQVLLLLINFLWAPSSVRVLLNPALHTLYVFVLFRGPLWGRLLCSIFACAFLVVSEALSLPFLALLGWNGTVHNQNPFFWSTLCNYLMLLWGVICYVLLRNVRLLIRNTLEPRTWLALLVCLLISIADMMFLFLFSPAADGLLAQPQDQWLFAFVHSDLCIALLLIFQFLFLCFLFVLTAQASTQAYERAQAAFQMECSVHQLAMYRQQALVLKQLRAMHHDLRGHLSAIDALGAAQDFERQRVYIERLRAQTLRNVSGDSAQR